MIANQRITLSHRLLVTLGLVSLLFWGVITTLTTRASISEVQDLYDVHLALTAKAFLHLMDPDQDEQHTLPPTLSSAAIERLFDNWPELPDRPSVGGSPPQAAASAPSGELPARTQRRLDSKEILYGNRLRYQLWRDDGSLLFRSDNAPLTATTLTAGYSDSTDAQGLGWRHYKVHDKHHGVWVIVSEPHEFRAGLVHGLLLRAAAPLALGLPVLLGLLWWSIRQGLHPLADLSLEISKRRADKLTLMDVQSVPGEVQPIVSALNQLLTRMADTLESERRFTDDAAHQLRTPLAAIQAQLYAARNTDEKVARQLALDRLQQGLERAIRLVNQMLALARLDPQQAQRDLPLMDLGAIAETVCAELAPLALQKNQTLELQVPPGLPRIAAHADMLAMLVSNLLDNAIHYAAQGGHIQISLTPDNTGLLLMVRDDGPGIAPDLRARVFERFYRIDPHGQPGTGLGLTICQRIAELHQTRITLSDGLDGRGLGVGVKFLTSP